MRAPSGAPAVSGTIYGLSGQTINLNGGTGCGFVNVTFTNATAIISNGYALAPGTYANVYGSGSCATSFVASTISLGAATSSSSAGGSGAGLNHVLTADYLGGYAGTHSVSAAQAAPVLSWAEVSSSDGNAVSAAGIKTLDYIDPFRQSSSDPLYGSDESTFSHDCSGNRIPITYSATVTQYLMNPASGDLAALMASWQDRELSAGHIDAFFYDDVDTLYGISVYPCGLAQAGWDAENADFIAASGHPVVFNGYGMNADSAAVIDLSTVAGGMVEDCYAGISSTYTTGTTWLANENLELAAAAAGKLFFCYNTPIGDAAASIAVRQYVYASFMLTYGAGSSVLWEHFSTPSGLHVFPETELVPASPSLAASSIAAFYTGGAYAREYGACYLAGSNVGPCAAIVNPTTAATAFPMLSRTYTHTMVLSGYGIVDGGNISVTAAPPPSSIPGETGIVVFP